MIKPVIRFHLIAIVNLLTFLSCGKDRVDCIEVTALGFGQYCQNTYLLQVPAKYGILGKAIEVDGQTYHHVIKIASGSLTLYDGLNAGDRIFVKLRKFNPKTDGELIVSPYPCTHILGPSYPEVPIYVATGVSGDGCAAIGL